MLVSVNLLFVYSFAAILALWASEAEGSIRTLSPLESFTIPCRRSTGIDAVKRRPSSARTA
jgi:hypothetical protein